jgi:hypothetical protein
MSGVARPTPKSGNADRIDPDSHRLVSTGLDRTVRVWEAAPVEGPEDTPSLLDMSGM